jgi:hypothetical protein
LSLAGSIYRFSQSTVSGSGDGSRGKSAPKYKDKRKTHSTIYKKSTKKEEELKTRGHEDKIHDTNQE